MTLSKAARKLNNRKKLKDELSKRTWFKVLEEQNGKLVSCHGGEMEWERPPKNGMNGPLVTSPTVRICSSGLHVTDKPLLWNGESPSKKVYVAEIPWNDPNLLWDTDDSDKISVSQLRLRNPSADELMQFGIVDTDTEVAIDCAPRDCYEVVVKNGKLNYRASRPSEIKLFNHSDLYTTSEGSVIRGRGQSTANVDHGLVHWHSKGELRLFMSQAFIYEACNVFAGAHTMVSVQRLGCTVFAAQGSVVIAEVDAHIIAQEGSVVVYRNGASNVMNETVAVVTASGALIEFVKLKNPVPTNGSVLF